jgi:hypothetical protein
MPYATLVKALHHTATRNWQPVREVHLNPDQPMRVMIAPPLCLPRPDSV